MVSCVMERVCSKISEHPLLGTCVGTLQMFWNNQHAKASTEILPPSPEQKERGGDVEMIEQFTSTIQTLYGPNPNALA